MSIEEHNHAIPGHRASEAQNLFTAAPNDLQETPGESIAPSDAELELRAEAAAAALIAIDLEKADERARCKSSVEGLGLELQKEAARRAAMLRVPVKKLAESSDDGGQVATSLIDLKVQVEQLDPARYDFEAGWAGRLFGRLPGVGSPARRYFSRYEKCQGVIAAIIKSLELGREELRRDNTTLAQDQAMMRGLTEKLRRAVRLGRMIDGKLQAYSDALPPEDLKRSFMAEELQFPLRQRIIDLEQQLAVNLQGVMAAELVIRNNQELIRGVDRALTVTVQALQVAVSAAMAVANQRIVLRKIEALGETTSGLIAATARRLKQQGASIHQQASTPLLNVEALRAAFADIHEAMQDIAAFRREALPQMSRAIAEMDMLSREAEQTISRQEAGNRLSPIIPLEID